jgi:hypothetical protein
LTQPEQKKIIVSTRRMERGGGAVIQRIGFGLAVALACAACSPKEGAAANVQAVKAAPPGDIPGKAVADVATRRAASALAAIGKDRKRCTNREENGPSEMQECDGDAWDAADAMLPRSRQNDAFDKLMQDLSDPLMFVLTPNEDSHDTLAQRVVVTSELTDMAIKRAAILSGVSLSAARPAPEKPLPPLFGWLDNTPGLKDWNSGDITARSAGRRWEAIRDADCAIYKVPRCAERIDAAMRATLRSTMSDE